MLGDGTETAIVVVIIFTFVFFYVVAFTWLLLFKHYDHKGK